MADLPAAFIAPPPRGRSVRNPLSLVRVDTAIARTAAGFGIAFFLQSIPAMIEQLPNLQPVWSSVIVTALVVSLALTALASAVRKQVRAAHIMFAVIYLVALVSWPFAVIDPDRATQDSYWLYYLLTIATAMATVGFPLRVATAYLLLAPAIYSVIRVMPAGGGVTSVQTALDSVYAVILGGAITIITAILRTAASSVDRAQATALDRYGHAVRQHAIESERVQVDAIVHDSVLTTFLSAARAETPEAKELAARMAGNAIGYLRDAVSVAPPSEADISIEVLASRIVDAAGALSEPIEMDVEDAVGGHVPVAVAEAMYSAAVQAMVNSLQHAGQNVERWARVRTERGGVVVEVGDRGAGFDAALVPNERLGVRVSILERVASVGGAAVVDTAVGEGTVVLLQWPMPPTGGSRP
ncbi:sensor histidine kinase [Homoserinibacter sp. GY 40078]|uniref:sensor histidine kinase n=1 Tax=Homoserinibacter sp. GY 40078 TaxID=2603275 RepID=UPI0011CC4FE3|nr:hypothetical protein [Homoserinibacter sp. GY 40078]TXK16232.1 hypothetical protein FVQ89_13305 [Homoserinibacter sp. GY 40078]